eukprot:TRINITY_DN12197_c0_g1_i9.p1 TRINITY_DN12197_c0_g1~~TRINITY_DN12197_c0_g1_i9.p1  ORF type:complete len:559 (-),score=102.40 TRINITY_DN12197_c0_g1_i9:2317-3966(-)
MLFDETETKRRRMITTDSATVSLKSDTMALDPPPAPAAPSRPARPPAAHPGVELVDTQEPEDHGFNYDLVVIGGGSGGLACAKAASDMGKKVACLDFVKPSAQGTTWGLGGTCVNVGCIPKKLMHTAGLVGETLNEAEAYGWNVPTKRHDWSTLVQNVESYIKSLNFGYRSELSGKGVRYINALAKFVGPHTIEATKKDGDKQTITARRFVIAVGGRPTYPDIPGCREYGITSDDIFKLKEDPGKSLCIGASYVSLECAGFLRALDKEVHVAMRSIPLRGFDQQMAQIVVDYMTEQGVKFLSRYVPTKVEKSQGGPHKYVVELQSTENPADKIVDTYDTVFFAVGRQADTAALGLDSVGIQPEASTGKLKTDLADRTSCPYIYAIGDVVKGGLELTPVAIHAGKLLASRLFAGGSKLMDYVNVPTTVFTPLEYGSVGYSEEAAIEKFGESVEVFHTNFAPLEWRLPHKSDNACYMKIIVNTADFDRVIGFHIASPNAGEIVQAVAVAIKAGATKEVFDDTIGIHPTIAEDMTALSISKSSGASAEKGGC